MTAALYSKKFLSQKFDTLYRRACAVSDQTNPCAIKGGSCHSMRVAPEDHINDPFCCKNCQYLKKEGCSVESLMCKLWLCDLAKENLSQKKDGAHAFVKLRRIYQVASRYNLLVLRGSKADSLKQGLADS